MDVAEEACRGKVKRASHGASPRDLIVSESFPHLFSPMAIGAYTLKNRIMNTGHAAHFQTGDGLPTRRYVDYVGERAKGGVGIVVTGHTVPYYDGDVALSLASYDDRIVPMYQRMAAATHAFDVPLLAQLGHRGRRVADGAAFLQRPSIAPSAVPAPDFSTPQLVPHAMTIAEIEETLEQFSAAARRAVAGDLDGIELSIGMDYLFPNFLNAQANRREDRYGGATLEERMTFVYETVDAVRGTVGPERILGIRMYDDLEDWGLRLDDYKQVARLLETHGKVDYFNMWQGIVPSPRSGRSHWPAHYYAPGAFAHLPRGIREYVSLPVVGTGRLDSPAVAERFIAEGTADLVGMARALIADPHLPNKAREGRTGDIRTCIACTQSCVGHVYVGMGVGCIYNPVTGREGEWAVLPPAAERRKVVVIGGGPAGMEAARIAAERGHEVVLFERGARLGGQVNLVMRTPARDNFEEIILFFERQLAKLGVDVRLRTEAGGRRCSGREPGCGGGRHRVERVPARGHRQRQASRAHRARGDPGQRRDRGERARRRYPGPGGSPHRRRADCGHGPQGRNRHRTRLRRLRDAGAGLAQPDGAPAAEGRDAHPVHRRVGDRGPIGRRVQRHLLAAEDDGRDRYRGVRIGRRPRR